MYMQTFPSHKVINLQAEDQNLITLVGKTESDRNPEQSLAYYQHTIRIIGPGKSNILSAWIHNLVKWTRKTWLNKRFGTTDISITKCKKHKYTRAVSKPNPSVSLATQGRANVTFVYILPEILRKALFQWMNNSNTKKEYDIHIRHNHKKVQKKE